MKAPDNITIRATKITNAAIKQQCQFIHAIMGEHIILHSSLSQTNSSVHLDLITTATKATKQQCYGATKMINKETSQKGKHN
jgi:hypothetical protein